MTRIVDVRCLNLSTLTSSPTFPAAEAKAVIQQNATIVNKNKFDAGIEELIKDFQWNTQTVSAKPLNNVTNEVIDQVFPLSFLVIIAKIHQL